APGRRGGRSGRRLAGKIRRVRAARAREMAQSGAGFRGDGGMKAKVLMLGLAAIVAALPAGAADSNRGREAPADPNKILRYAFEIAETTFDTQKVSDLYSN